MTKKTITKRTWKLLLGICIAAVLSIGIGLFAYIHMIDTKTLGRKISIYGLDVSKLTAEKAQQKINEAFHNKNIIFHEDGEDVYSVSMAQLGYSLEQDSLRNELETLQQERSQDFRLFASEKDYTIDYQIIKNENQEKTALAAENFDNKERTESADAHIRYSKKKKKYILVKQVQGNQIDENRLLNYVEETLDKDFETELLHYNYSGKLSELDFLKRIYNLEQLPSYDGRYLNAEGDIWQHTVNNDDYQKGWAFDDERFKLSNGDDEIFLKFLCAVFHPAVREERGCWQECLISVNELLRMDGYELYPSGKISGRDIYNWREYNDNEIDVFVPFSQRNEKAIRAHSLKLYICMKARNQICALFEKYNDVYRETNETGFQYDVTTEEYVFRDISCFYEPRCYNRSSKYVRTRDMKQFILHNSPFCVFDAIELYFRYNADNNYSKEMNALLVRQAIGYQLIQGKLKCTVETSLSENTIAAIPEKGLKELVTDAENYYRDGNKQIAVEKLWDAFERLKTYYSPKLDKKNSANKVVETMSHKEPHFQKLYEDEFKVLTEIGNGFRIRHHETTQTDITDDRQYDYFYQRCHALISTAIFYLEESVKSEAE